MIDIENDIFSAVAVPIREKYNAYVTGEYVDAPPRFPAVTVFQIDNSVIESRRTLIVENAASVPFEVNVYDNTTGYKKQKVKEIMASVDKIMERLGFVRTYCAPTPNIADATIYRMTARYKAAVDKDLWVYQN